MSYQDVDQTRRISAGDLSYGYSILGLAAQTDHGNGTSATTEFVRDDLGTLVEELVPNNNRAFGHYDHFYYLFDSLGTVAGLADENGARVGGGLYTYEPYGKPLADPVTSTGNPNPWRFAAGYYDRAAGLYKFGTRYYDPSVGRWTQADTNAGDITDPLSPNRYVYVEDNPANAMDPSGTSLLDYLSFSLFGGCFIACLNLSVSTSGVSFQGTWCCGVGLFGPSVGVSTVPTAQQSTASLTSGSVCAAWYYGGCFNFGRTTTGGMWYGVSVTRGFGVEGDIFNYTLYYHRW
jgi:RHS repeat-associated protein